MKKILKILIPAFMALMLPLCARAYNVVDLPESMTFSDALSIFDAGEITNVTVSNISDGRYITLDSDAIREFYSIVSNLNVYRSVNPTPFRGIAVNIYTNGGVKTYCINSGLQIGLYGSENYICYKLSDSDTEKILYLESRYYDDETKAGGEIIHRDTSRNFLKLSQSPWSRSFINEAAAKSLLPYEFTGIYQNNISREQFCVLLGNMLAVNEGYASIEDYMSDKGGAYLKNYFDDCAGVDNSVNILYALGIVNGRDDTHFEPYGTITREEAATLLCKTAERYMWIGTETNLGYEDTWSISEWARFFVTWANEYGIMTGISDTEFAPHETYTVEQAIATVVRLYELIN